MDMKNIDYSKLDEITVKSQSELDAVPDNFAGRIYIEFGTVWNKAVVRKKYAKRVEARGNSSVEAWENSSVEANGNVQVVDRLVGGRVEITGNARIVYMPKTIEEYCSFYGIKHDKKTGKFFKAVHKDFVKIADKKGEWKTCRGGVYFQQIEGDAIRDKKGGEA